MKIKESSRIKEWTVIRITSERRLHLGRKMLRHISSAQFLLINP